MKKYVLMALTAIFALSLSAQCPKKEGCCKQQTSECCQKNNSKDKKCKKCKKSKKKATDSKKCDKAKACDKTAETKSCCSKK